MRNQAQETVSLNQKKLNFFYDSNRVTVLRISANNFLSRYQVIVNNENDHNNGLIAKHFHAKTTRLFKKCIIEGEIMQPTSLENIHFIEVDFSLVTGPLMLDNCTFDEKCIGYQRFVFDESVTHSLTRSDLSLLTQLHTASNLNKKTTENVWHLSQFQSLPEEQEKYAETWSTPSALSENLSYF